LPPFPLVFPPLDAFDVFDDFDDFVVFDDLVNIGTRIGGAVGERLPLVGRSVEGIGTPMRVGSAVAVGFNEGETVGEKDGAKVGDTVGESDGLKVGERL